uniref:DNA topoisomerase n=1 Tax=Ditylenchus dipsaci TaxID=166011 RepID=A0A915DD97_9BILA
MSEVSVKQEVIEEIPATNVDARVLRIAGELQALVNQTEAVMQKAMDEDDQQKFLGCLNTLHSAIGDVVHEGLALAETGWIRKVRDEEGVIPFVYEEDSTPSIRYDLVDEKLLSDVNFCQCEYFLKVILERRRFTCRHVLAARFAKVCGFTKDDRVVDTATMINILKGAVSICLMLQSKWSQKMISFQNLLTSILWLQIFRNFASKRAAKTSQTSKELGELLNTAKLVKKDTEKMVANKRVLCVAEKNDAAKHISHILSRNHCALREGRSKFNKLYCFEGDVLVFTSVSGHLTALEFDKAYKNWDQRNISALFSAPVIRSIPDNMSGIELTSGENIGAEIVSVCRQANPRIDVYRAKFSEITPRSVNNAMQNLVRMDDRIVNAVDCRTELDLRIGAAFTRLQTLHLQKHFANILDGVISYGSCQFPTLGFVVERYKAIKSFVSEQFWKLVGKDLNNKFDFSWERVRLFDMDATRAIHELCKEAKQAKVVLVDKHPKSKWRPQPLDTIEMEKLGIRKLKMTAKRVMAAAESCINEVLFRIREQRPTGTYQVSNLREIVEAQTVSFEWGEFAAGILNNGAPNPRDGNKSDQAHPPIHPTKYVTRNEIPNSEEWRVYELVVRHFLASVSRDAKGQETDVRVEVGGEFFRATGLIVEDLGYLNVWTYDKWADKTMPSYQLHQILPKFVSQLQVDRQSRLCY